MLRLSKHKSAFPRQALASVSSPDVWKISMYVCSVTVGFYVSVAEKRYGHRYRSRYTDILSNRLFCRKGFRLSNLFPKSHVLGLR